jgi:hypothetical protein
LALFVKINSKRLVQNESYLPLESSDRTVYLQLFTRLYEQMILKDKLKMPSLGLRKIKDILQIKVYLCFGRLKLFFKSSECSEIQYQDY